MRKARTLTEFGNWVDLALNGYLDKKVGELPEYRNLQGILQAFNPYRGWVPISFASPEQEKNCSFAPIGMAIGAIEDSLRDAKSTGAFYVPYPPEISHELRKSLNVNWINDLHIALNRLDCAYILHAVRNILLDWTIAMEKQGVVGGNLTFSPV